MGEVSYKIYKEKLLILFSFAFITDVPVYRAFSPVFIYSVCLYIVFNMMSFLSAKDNVLHLFKKDDNISGTVSNILLIVMLVNCTGVPVLAWIDTPKFVQYLHKWEQFQVGSNGEFMLFIINKKIISFLLFYISIMRHEIRKKTNLK
jgi:hypothetical protein